MQPHYLPWPGYFNLMSKVDKYIFLDDVQFSKNSWQSRNQIIIDNHKKWITIPTKKSSLKTNINSKLIDFSKNWQLKQSKTIIQAYSKHSYIKDLEELMNFCNTIKLLNLSDYNIEILKFLSFKLHIKVEFIKSSVFNSKKERTYRVIEILEKIKASEYLSPIGAKDYLEQDKFNEITKVKLKFNDFQSMPYVQKKFKPFLPNLSIIDLIANLGWTEATRYVNLN
tara:strand:- start:33 stop:707 length:675 start_codon:yes stop_codon:yes gene_type:complete